MSRYDYERERYGRGREDRGFFDRAGDEVRSWFGDEEAERRRRFDEREGYTGGSPGGEFGRGREGYYGREGYGYEPSRRGYESGRYPYESSRWGYGSEPRSGYSGYGGGSYEPRRGSERQSERHYGSSGWGGESWRGGGYGSESWRGGGEGSRGEGSVTGMAGAAIGRRSEFSMGRGRFAGRGPSGYRRSDDRIREDINDRLTEHPDIDAINITVQVKDGEITLTGSVEDRYQKRLAEDVAEDVTGVREVNNQLRLNPGGIQGEGQETSSRRVPIKG